MTQSIVQIIFIRDSLILLGFRQNTKYYDQLWGFPAGRIELGEQPQESALRESLEEVAVEPINLSFLTQLSDPNVDCQHYVYVCDDWKGEIKNAEPYLCREVCWFDIEELPTDCTPTTQSVIVELKRYLRT
ncbi:NUDIX domain-containing protein [Moritella sp. 5]|uniref:NUDIX domain-containing protein n=1 Tax=Moritella sp. 5 TaxID=2746231 RepID=UPI001BAE23D3|nr:NUDIX domain-containing protein [Moritella sp. 5]QUM81521.1 NUDIX domain-containing protein [Moritella sp. 5]